MELQKIQKKQLRISHQTRKELIRLVTCENMSVKYAHSRLGINYSTAKMIVRKYRQSGKITHFRRERQSSVSENSSLEVIQSSESSGIEKIAKNEENHLYQGQQIPGIQFQTYYVPTQQYGQAFDLFNMANQFYCVPPMFVGYPVQNYFSF